MLLLVTSDNGGDYYSMCSVMSDNEGVITLCVLGVNTLLLCCVQYFNDLSSIRAIVSKMQPTHRPV